MLSFLPNPLHPAVVHLPMALAVLIPVFAAGSLYAVHRGARPLRAWGVTTALFAALSASAWLSLNTGQAADEQVESVVASAPIETHEEAAEAFLALSGLVLAVSLVGLRSGKLGSGGRVAATVGAFALLASGWNVGHSGGALVYQYGAANAYGKAGGAAETAALPATASANPDGDDTASSASAVLGADSTNAARANGRTAGRTGRVDSDDRKESRP